MQLCYIDESGTPDLPGNTSHYILAGLSVPDSYWKRHHTQLEKIKTGYGLEDAEIHVGWMMRPYDEQRLISAFAMMTHERRRSEVSRQRNAEPLRIQKANGKGYRQTRKNYQKTEAYVHLTMDERRQAATGIAKLVSDWGVARLFAECIDKLRFDPARTNRTVHEPAFERVVSRFERYLQRDQSDYRLLIHDNNQTVAKKHTERMKAFLQKGTLWTHIEHAIETPISVDSQLTNMVPLADLCA